MIVNVGTLDRVVRAILGVALLWLAFASGFPVMDSAFAKYGAALVGVVMLVVAAMRHCPIYSIFGFKTCRAA